MTDNAKKSRNALSIPDSRLRAKERNRTTVPKSSTIGARFVVRRPAGGYGSCLRKALGDMPVNSRNRAVKAEAVW